MQFRKIDDNKIHCIISQEEMSQNGYSDRGFLRSSRQDRGVLA